jgi:hypothetical protein
MKNNEAALNKATEELKEKNQATKQAQERHAEALKNKD